MKHLFPTLLLSVTISISLAACIYYFGIGHDNLLDYDAIARLNIARKMIDSLTPGVGQLGGVWLPFPQMLMLPFIWNNELWHTGIAGMIISSLSFIFGAFFLYKTAFLITNNRFFSLLVWLVFVTNVNILFVQTTALSEMFFMFCLIMVVYFLTKWVKNHEMVHFLWSAFFVMVITLTRYEGYFVFIASLLVVLAECIRTYKRQGSSKVEGMVLLFATVAGYGVFLWCIYSALFFKDPFYWIHIYAGTGAGATTVRPAVAQNVTDVTNNKTIVESAITYGRAVIWTNGLIPAILGLLGVFAVSTVVIKRWIRKQKISTYLPLFFISNIMLMFLIYGYYKGLIPTIAFPGKGTPFNTPNSNIRYGLIIAPLIALLIGVTASRNKVLAGLIILLFGFQLYANNYQQKYLKPDPTIPDIWYYKTVKQVPWFKTHYDGGLIMISSNVHENFMFQTGLPYKTFIYEGTRDYWTLSLKNPALFAKWVIYDTSLPDDSVQNFLTKNGRKILNEKFDLVYQDGGFKIFRRRT